MTTAAIIGLIILFALGYRIFSNLGTYTGLRPPGPGAGAVVFAIYVLGT